MLPPVVDAPPAEPQNTVAEENFPEDVHATRRDDYIGVAWPPEDLEDCWLVRELNLLSITKQTVRGSCRCFFFLRCCLICKVIVSVSQSIMQSQTVSQPNLISLLLLCDFGMKHYFLTDKMIALDQWDNQSIRRSDNQLNQSGDQATNSISQEIRQSAK